MPDVELSVVAHGEEEPPSVGTYARQGGGLCHGRAVEEQMRCGETARGRVEVECHEPVAYLVVVRDDAVGACQRMVFALEGVRDLAQGREGGGAVVEAFSVGSPGGEGFHLHGGLRDVRNTVLLHIVEDEV